MQLSKAMIILWVIIVVVRAAVALMALIELIGLIWFAGTYSPLEAVSGMLSVAGSFAIAFIPTGVIQRRNSNIAYISLLALTVVATVVLMAVVAAWRYFRASPESGRVRAG